MRVTAIIVGLLAVVMGGGCLMLAGGTVNSTLLLGAWLQLVIGGALVVYAATLKGGAPFPTAARRVVWLVGCVIAVWVVFCIYLLATLKIH